jgi:hypothetical protein
LVDQLNSMLSQSWQVPFSPYRLVRTREMEQLIERMRINVPSSIRESEKTLQERDKILAEARQEADRVIQQAKQQAMEMLSERSLLETAQSEAERIVDDSRELARRRAEEADAYTLQVLQELAQRLHGVLQQVENGIHVMQENRPQPNVPGGQPPRKAPRGQAPGAAPPTQRENL